MPRRWRAGRTDPARSAPVYTVPRPEPGPRRRAQRCAAARRGRRLAARPRPAGRGISAALASLCRGERPGRAGPGPSAAGAARPARALAVGARAPALARARAAGHADRRQHRRRDFGLCARRQGRRQPPGRGRRARRARRPSSPRRSTGWSPTRPGRCRARSRRRDRSPRATPIAPQRHGAADGWIVQQSGPRNSLGLVKFDLEERPGNLPARHPRQGAFARPSAMPATAACASPTRSASPR